MNWVSSKTCLVVFFEVDDNLFGEVQRNRNWHLRTDLISKMTDSVGDNAIITLLVSNDGVNEIRRLFNENEKKYKNIGFWSRGHKKFFVMKGDSNGINKT